MNQQQGQKKCSNIEAGMSATLLPDENSHPSFHLFPLVSNSFL